MAARHNYMFENRWHGMAPLLFQIMARFPLPYIFSRMFKAVHKVDHTTMDIFGIPSHAKMSVTQYFSSSKSSSLIFKSIELH